MKTRSCCVVLALAAWAVAGVVARAQAPGAPKPAKVYTKGPAFKLPVTMDEQDRPRIQEVQLFVRAGPNSPWEQARSAAPTEKFFTYQVPQDGEYGFCVVTVDKAGVRTPANLAQEPPQLVVVVDRQPPTVDVRPAMGPTGEALLQCEVHDLNPDFGKTRVEFLNADHNWQPLEPVPDKPGLFKVPDPAAVHGVVRVTAADLAGNKTTRELNPFAPAGGVSTVAAVESRSDKVAVPPPPAGFPPPAPAFPPAPSSAMPPPAPAFPPPPGAPAAGSSALAMAPAPIPPPLSPPGVNTSGAPATNHPLLNNTHATLRYQVDQEGPAGLSRVEVWMTRDDGLTWERLCEDPDRRSPVEINLPGDGVYGLSVVACNATGNGSLPPARGDVPDYRLEVDTTRPEAQLLGVRPGAGPDSGAFFISWTASDKNLKSDGIDLDYATGPAGPWQPVAHGVHNDGTYRWAAAGVGGGPFYFRLQVTDLAGNVSTCVTPAPVALEQAKTKVHVLNVVAGADRLGASGN